MNFTTDMTGVTGWISFPALPEGGRIEHTEPVPLLVVAGIGDDTVYGGFGGDRIVDSWVGLAVAGTGDDRFFGMDGDDWLEGETGKDRLVGGLGKDLIYGGDDGDTLLGLQGDDTLWGDAGDDFLEGHGGTDVADGGLGADTIIGGNEADLLYGGEDSDLMFGGAGLDLLAGGFGDDTMDGGAESDLYRIDSLGDVVNDTGTDGIDNIQARYVSINLRLHAGIEIAQLKGWQDVDAIGTANAEQFVGNSGNNIIKADGGNDYVYAGSGQDQLFGGAGDDFLTSGRGSDTMTGGVGADFFSFSAEDNLGLRGQSDVITDFKQGVDLLGFAMFAGSFTLVRTFSGDGTDAEFRFDTNTQRLFCDVESDGTADFAVELQGLTTVSLSDFYF